MSSQLLLATYFQKPLTIGQLVTVNEFDGYRVTFIDYPMRVGALVLAGRPFIFIVRSSARTKPGFLIKITLCIISPTYLS